KTDIIFSCEEECRSSHVTLSINFFYSPFPIPSLFSSSLAWRTNNHQLNSHSISDDNSIPILPKFFPDSFIYLLSSPTLQLLPSSQTHCFDTGFHSPLIPTPLLSPSFQFQSLGSRLQSFAINAFGETSEGFKRYCHCQLEFSNNVTVTLGYARFLVITISNAESLLEENKSARQGGKLASL
ncbi:hypothetical protein SDJN02_05740, partial [Cucurbita argyrosperma subsp. argyrosperma]